MRYWQKLEEEGRVGGQSALSERGGLRWEGGGRRRLDGREEGSLCQIIECFGQQYQHD